jgi:hypothetical protein
MRPPCAILVPVHKNRQRFCGQEHYLARPSKYAIATPLASALIAGNGSMQNSILFQDFQGFGPSSYFPGIFLKHKTNHFLAVQALLLFLRDD